MKNLALFIVFAAGVIMLIDVWLSPRIEHTEEYILLYYNDPIWNQRDYIILWRK